MLSWSSAELAEKSGLSRRTIAKSEACDGLPDINIGTMKKLVSALESAGIEFTGTPDYRPGIVMRL